MVDETLTYLYLPTRGLYRDINQLSASDKIRCSGTELLFKTWMRSFLFFLSYSFRILVDHQFPHQRSEGESVALPMQNGETDHFFSTKRSRLLHSFDPSLGSVSSISTRNFVPRRGLFFFFFFIMKQEGRKEGIYISAKSIRDEVRCGLRYNRHHRARDNATMSTVSQPVR